MSLTNCYFVLICGRLKLDPRPKDLRTQGAGTQQSSSVGLSFYDRNATCVNVQCSNVQLYRCGPQSPYCYAPINVMPHYPRMGR